MQPWTALRRCLQAQAVLRSLHRQSRVIRLGPLEGLEELPSGRRERKRREFFAQAKHVAAAIEALDACLPRDRQVLSVLVSGNKQAAQITQLVKRADYRLGGSEFLFARRKAAPALATCEFSIVLVDTLDLAERVAKEQRHRLTAPQHLGNLRAGLRLYCALDGQRPIGWVQSVAAGPGTRYVANLVTIRAYRRRGVATALMRRLLRDDQALECESSVLLSSHSGRGLYEALGYQELGRVLMFWGRNR